MLNRIVLLALVLSSLTFSLAGAQNNKEVQGFVVNVAGDGTLVVSVDHRAELVRLAGITFPNEGGQDSHAARAFVSAMVLHKTVRIQSLGKDLQGYILGRIYCGNRCLNEALIQNGLAQPAQ
jgi:endonuclease YncB( thermonuclease family)